MAKAASTEEVGSGVVIVTNNKDNPWRIGGKLLGAKQDRGRTSKATGKQLTQPEVTFSKEEWEKVKRSSAVQMLLDKSHISAR